MSRFSDKLDLVLLEIFQAPTVSPDVKFDDTWYFVTSEFVVDGNEYVVKFLRHMDTNYFEVLFRLASSYRYKRTGHGAVKILNSVVGIIGAFVREYDPDALFWTGADEVLDRVYTRLIRRLVGAGYTTANVGDYTAIIKDDEEVISDFINYF